MNLLPALSLLTSIPTLAPQESRERWTQEGLERVSAQILEEVERMRGQEFARPVKVELADKETFLQHATERIEKLMTPELVAGNEMAARLLGLIPPDMDLMETSLDVLKEQVGGFYSPGTDTFYLMDSFTGPVAKIILAHELTHALDDQLFDIDSTFMETLDNTDASFAYGAVVEGSGTSLMSQWQREHLGSDIDLEDLAEVGDMGADVLMRTPPYIWMPLLASYTRGASFLVRSDSMLTGQVKTASTEDVTRAFEEPPLSSEQVLHPEKYWDPEQRDDPRVIEFEASDLPRGFEVLYEDTLGEIHLSLVTRLDPLATPQSLAAIQLAPATNELAQGWGGDRLVVAGSDEARYMRLVTLWDTERDAAEFYGAMTMRLPSLEESVARVAELELGEGARARAAVELAYGESPDSVVLTLHFGLRRSQVRALSEGLVHRERK